VTLAPDGVPADSVVVLRSAVGSVLARAGAAMDAVARLDRLPADQRLALLDWWFWIAAHQLAREVAGPPRPIPLPMTRARGKW
jgi:hypothetical protein